MFGAFVLIESIHLHGHQERPCVHRGADVDF